jgi:ribonuclease HI
MGTRAFFVHPGQGCHGECELQSSDFTIVFDGGSIGNPGRGYGSYALFRQSDGMKQIKRLNFPGRVTNNEAEYDTLAIALETLAKTMRADGQDPALASVEARGDSQLVIYQLTGRWKAREPRMQERRDRILAIARQFKRVSYIQHPRAESVKILGH